MDFWVHDVNRVRKEKIETAMLNIIIIFIVDSCLLNPCNQGICIPSTNCQSLLCGYSCNCSNGTSGYYKKKFIERM